ncbi:glucosamine-6-phosphate deaminase [Chitinophaga parva]|uniref:Glucosamine-6-phosphate deaminase n=1 Tax=Chitinophaga parva TaxID=2169414 RepID=A0A2T7BHA2_9BACT|nr:glucosamine-6-phosphate deaminase [Chitinophaga parva]PUZ25652.1 glucosamine-6-phosphate deaminase [Chitinophaga parva]
MMFKKDNLTVHVSPTRQALGRHAAALVAQYLQVLTAAKSEVNVIFAAAPSQNEFLAALVADPEIQWHKINAFHMDEYIGLPADAPQGFGNFLRTRIFEQVPFASVHYLGDNIDAYTQLLELHKPDVVCMGIGENTHIAFNDPPADFLDTALVKKVTLDHACRQQQVNDGCFASIEQVPTHAITLTIPALMQAGAIFCMVPGPTKRQAVYHTLTEPVSETYPSTILRTHANAVLFVDEQSYQPI